MSGDLTLDVYVSDYKSIPGDPAVMSEGQATWPASSVSLLSGERDAVLIDALITFDEARQAAEWIRAKGKRLTTIYITHGHGDHMFGLNTLLAAFPGARAVALAEVMPAIQSQVTPGYLEFWGTLFPGQIPERPVLPEALDSNVIDLEGHELRLINVGQSDTDPSTVLYNGLGRHDTARDAAWGAFEHDQLGYGPFVVPELAEAASRTGDVTLLRAALEWLSERTRVTPTEWALGMEARVRALLSEGDSAESLYRESIARLGRTRVRAELARAHLLYGEWLRRERRRADARIQLRTAHDMLDAMGIGAFAERARRELAATGETARKRTLETRDELTAQECRIARLARDGLSNPEIGARLFISTRTVQYHLGKVFAKLGISYRSQLDRVLPTDPATAQPH